MASIDGVKSVVINAELEQLDEMLFDFLLEFGRENKLQIERIEQFDEN